MNWSSILSGLGILVCTFALTWATARHFTDEQILAEIDGVLR